MPAVRSSRPPELARSARAPGADEPDLPRTGDADEETSGEHRVTFEAAARLDPDESPQEIASGAWSPVSRNSWRHGEVASNIAFVLKQYARTHAGFRVAVGDPGAKLAHGPDILRGPDVALIRSDRRPTGKGVDGWLEGAPDVAIEVAGDRQSPSDLLQKGMEYLVAGAKLVWLVDLESERVIVLVPPNHVEVLGATDTLTGRDALPGLSTPVSAFFE